MALPTSGTISFNDIVQELGFNANTPFSLQLREVAGQRQVYANNTWTDINMCSSILPSVVAPFHISDWYGYDHTEICCNNSEVQWFPAHQTIIAHPTVTGDVLLTLALKPLPSPPNDPIPPLTNGHCSAADAHFQVWSFGVWNNVTYYDTQNGGRWLWQTQFTQDNINREYRARKKGCTHEITTFIVGTPDGTIDDGCSTIIFYAPVLTNNGNGTTTVQVSVTDVGQTIEFSIDNGAWTTGGNVFTNVHEAVNVTSDGRTVNFRARIQGCSTIIETNPAVFIGNDPDPVYSNSEINQILQKNDCDPDENGSLVQVYVAYGKYTNSISQANVDQLALDDAQTQANNNGECISEPPQFFSPASSGILAKPNCPAGTTPLNVPYDFPYGAFTSYINQLDANNKLENAKLELAANASEITYCQAGCNKELVSDFNSVSTSNDGFGNVTISFLVTTAINTPYIRVTAFYNYGTIAYGNTDITSTGSKSITIGQFDGNVRIALDLVDCSSYRWNINLSGGSAPYNLNLVTVTAETTAATRNTTEITVTNNSHKRMRVAYCNNSSSYNCSLDSIFGADIDLLGYTSKTYNVGKVLGLGFYVRIWAKDYTVYRDVYVSNPTEVGA